MTGLAAWLQAHVIPRLTLIAAVCALLSWLVTTHVGQRANREIAAASRLIATNQQHRATLLQVRFARDNREDIVMIGRRVNAEDGRNPQSPTTALMDNGEYLVMVAFVNDLVKAVHASTDTALQKTAQDLQGKIAALESRIEKGQARLLQQLRDVASVPSEAGQAAWVKENGKALEDTRQMIVGALDEGHRYVSELNPVAEWANIDAESHIEHWQDYASAADWFAYAMTLVASTAAVIGQIVKTRQDSPPVVLDEP